MGAADFETGLDLLNAVQLDGNEAAAGTRGDYALQCQGYLRRAYWEILTRERWPWALAETPGVITTEEALTTANQNGVVVTSISDDNPAVVTLAAALPVSVAGWKFYLDGDQVIYRIRLHDANTPTFTLDARWVNPDDRSGPFTIYQDEYDLDPDVMRIWDSMYVRSGENANYEIVKRERPQLNEIAREGTFGPAPMGIYAEIASRYVNGVPIRRIQVAPWDEDRQILEYDYTEFHTLDFSGSRATDTPRIPREYRQLLVDLALYKLHMAKDDTRANPAFLNGHRLYQEMIDVYLGGARGQLVVRPQHAASLGLTDFRHAG